MKICRVFVGAIGLGFLAACTIEPDGSRAPRAGGPTLEECLHHASGVYFVRVEQDTATARFIVEEVWRHDSAPEAAPQIGTELKQRGGERRRLGGTEIPDHAVVFDFQPPLQRLGAGRTSQSDAMVFDGYVRIYDLSVRRIKELVQATVRESVKPVELHPIGKPVSSRPGATIKPNPNYTQPRAISRALPIYPRDLRAQRVGGEALIDVRVKKDGTVGETHIVYATDVRFGEAAEECVRRWRFEPATKNGAPIDTQMQIPIIFTMQ